MKHYLFIATVFLSACGGTLSDEQRKRFKEGMEQEKIVRASDTEIVAHALDKGHQVYDALKTIRFDAKKMDSIQREHRVRIGFMVPGKGNALAVEQELIDAYINSIALGGANQENLQKMWTDTQKKDYDSMIYTQPKLLVRPDGVEELEGIWNIYIAKRDVVLDIGRQSK
jgi:hypothetical protein